MSWWTSNRDAVTGEVKGLSMLTKVALGVAVLIVVVLVALVA
jgi:hypothetical protein